MSKLLSDSQLKEILKTEYRYFSDEKHICILVDYFETLFFHKYGGWLSEWEKRITKDKLHLKSISGFEYVFPLIKKPQVDHYPHEPFKV